MYYGSLAVNPLDVPHYPQCEDGEHYYCTNCDYLIVEGQKSRNWCDQCGKFAPQPTQCICESLQEIYE